MANPMVKSVTQKGEKAAMIHFDVGQAAWSPDYQTAVTLVGKPLPADWRLEQGEYGPKALPPKQGKGGGGWRQSKEAFDAEQAGRIRWQQVGEERRDRRTALMQAVTARPEAEARVVLGWANQFYEWLRTSPAGGPPAQGRGMAAQGGEPSTEENAPPPQAGGTTSAEGEAAVEAGPGEPSLSPGSAPCNHKGASGNWLKTRNVDGIPRCPRCGANAVIYRESA